VGPAASTNEFEEDVDGGPPWEALPACPTLSATEFEDDVDGRTSVGRCRQHPPPSLKTMSMAGPLGGSAGMSDSIHHRF
jgi:hypothetical protein